MADGGRGIPRARLAELRPSSRSAAEILAEQNLHRIQHLVPLRYERMLSDEFAFFRGSAAVMAADLADGPDSGIEVLSCGDAHLSNFGVYAAPDRAVLFDLNDFDEVAFAPAEWDIKRLATSIVISGRHRGQSERSIEAAVSRALSSYQRALRVSVKRSPVERYYQRVEPERVATGSRSARDVAEQVIRKARSRTSERAFAKLVDLSSGQPRLRESPVLQRLDATESEVAHQLFGAYRASASIDIAYLLGQYELADVALRVVGVGSVGTRCYLTVLIGPRESPLILQVKQASASVLVSYGDRTQPEIVSAGISARGEGARVVGGQRVMQAGSDVFLGSVRHQHIDFYVRQFHDMKGSAEIETLSRSVWADYAAACATVLAYAHARSPRSAEFADYLGRGTKALDAIRRWSFAYADKVTQDFRELASTLT